MRQVLAILVLCGIVLAGLAGTKPTTDKAATLVVHVDQARCESAIAKVRGTKLEARGRVAGQEITFAGMATDTAYDLRLVLSDGRVVEGADMSWYSLEPARADAEPLADDDREQIRSIVSDVRQFYDRSEVVLLSGNHDRATALVQQVRDSTFHSDKGGEVIWRVELWYFKNQHGGWERIGQQNKILVRERFATAKEYQDATGQLSWSADLGGIRIKKGQAPATLTLRLDDKTPATAPTAQASQ